MTVKAAITVLGSEEELRQLWQSTDHGSDELAKAAVAFRAAPGDRGTEIHVELDGAPGGKVGEIVQKVAGSGDPRAKAMDGLRRFKQLVETGEITRSDATPDGDSVVRKRKPQPAQPLDESQLQKADT